MKSTSMGQIITIEAKKAYTTDELFALLQEQCAPELGTPELKKSFGFKNIVFPGVGGFCNMVSASKNKISIMQQKESGKGILKSMAIDAVTDGFGSLFNVEGRGNAAVMEAIGKEIERLVC